MERWDGEDMWLPCHVKLAQPLCSQFNLVRKVRIRSWEEILVVFDSK